MERIVIASRSGARMYSYSPGSGFELEQEYENPSGRMRDRQVLSDQPGMSRARYKNLAPHSLNSEKSPHNEAAEKFALELVRDIEQKLKQRDQLRIKLVAEAKFLGLVRKSLRSQHLEPRIEWVDKDLQNVPETEWQKILELAPRPKPDFIGHRFPN
jgi:protein required for attachment to host cells